ncbi:MAG: YaaA family protein [Sulfurospirillum sp.]|nr:YaaA family protein [Sulfurospirillum sp.]
MKILFSPSETKSNFTNSNILSSKSLVFSELFNKRLHVIEKLNFYLKDSNTINLNKFFGIKNQDECERLANIDILSSKTCKAIQRYTGVSYKYLDFKTLENDQQKWLYKNTMIFSNLFGPILAGDNIPYYRFKQGSTIDGFKPELFYKNNFTEAINDYINTDFVIDLRAGFYEKFYTLASKHITMKFIKDKKVVSHFAKIYRGKVLRELAIKQPKSIEEFENINFHGLSIEEIIDKKLKKEYVYKIN